MTDSTLNRFLAQGDDAAEAAFTPDPPTPASGPDPLQLFLNVENPASPVLKYWDGDSFEPAGSGSGDVVASGTLTSGQLVIGDGGTSIDVGNLSGAVTTSGGTVTTLANGLNPDFATLSMLTGYKFQTFAIQIINSAGTLQHRIFGSQDFAANYVASPMADKVSGASTTLANTPTVGVGTGFTSGAGITGNAIVFNTAAQDNTKFMGWTGVEYYDGNVVNPRSLIGILSANINGTTQARLYIWLTNVLTGAAWTINTTNLPSGKSIFVRVTVFLA